MRTRLQQAEAHKQASPHLAPEEPFWSLGEGANNARLGLIAELLTYLLTPARPSHDGDDAMMVLLAARLGTQIRRHNWSASLLSMWVHALASASSSTSGGPWVGERRFKVVGSEGWWVVGPEIHAEERRCLERPCLGERGVFELRRSLDGSTKWWELLQDSQVGSLGDEREGLGLG